MFLRSFSSHIEEVFTKKVLQDNPRSYRVTIFSNPKTKKYRTDSVAYKSAQFWGTPPARYKNLSSLDLFESEIKQLTL